MLRTAFRDGLAAARAAGWRAYALALLGYVPVVAAQMTRNVVASLAALVLQVVVALALIRLIGAARPVPIPPPPQVDEQGRRVLLAPRPGPALSEDDRRIRVAVRHAFALWRPALTLTSLFLLAQYGALLTVLALSGGDALEYEPDVLLLAVLPVSALFLAFLALAPQRVALEGETRVLVATAHSVRIARTAYGLLLLLTVAEPVVTGLGGLLLPDENPPVGQLLGIGAGTLVVVALVQVVVTAVANEVYLNGPRLELPVDPAG